MRKIGLTGEGDEMSQAIIERVPEVALATRLVTGHAEAVLVGCEVPEVLMLVLIIHPSKVR